MTVLIHIDNAIRILEADIPRDVARLIEADLTLPNPKWEQAELYSRSRRRNFQPEMLTYYHRDSGVLILPRGYINHLRAILKSVPYNIVDKTRTCDQVEFSFDAALHPYQADAVDRVAAHRFGVLEAPPGAGKTVIALKIIAHRRQPSLVIVHTKELMYQWCKRACEFLQLSEKEIGLIGDGLKILGKNLTIAIIHSLYKIIDEIKPLIGHVIVDECHHIPARTFTDAVGRLDTAYMLGLSATPYRRDKLTRLIYFHLGDNTHRIDPQQLQAIDRIMCAQLVLRNTNCRYYFDSDEYQFMISALVADKARNSLIIKDVIQQARAESHGIALVVSDRVSHCEHLYKGILDAGMPAYLLTGSVPVKKRAGIIEKLNTTNAGIIVATAQLIGEGFDLKHLSSIFLATPVKFTGRVKQYIGRILRVAEGKEEALIFDYVDDNGMLKSSFRSRLSAYRDMGVQISGIKQDMII
ncbi:MAG TPA: DEAD/DEAH box helicase [Deltaproteobacteria bacterium]|nr:DEAD/DEAH box helicase [Deltaproteobacteria bacterium]